MIYDDDNPKEDPVLKLFFMLNMAFIVIIGVVFVMCLYGIYLLIRAFL